MKSNRALQEGVAVARDVATGLAALAGAAKVLGPALRDWGKPAASGSDAVQGGEAPPAAAERELARITSIVSQMERDLGVEPLEGATPSTRLAFVAGRIPRPSAARTRKK